MKRLAVLAASAALGSCALPPALTVTSYVADGISLVTSGKSIGDHALSIASGQDCSVLRVVRGRAICQEFAPGETPYLVAEAERWARSGEIVGQGPAVLDDTPEAAPVMAGDGEGTDPLMIPQVAGLDILLPPVAAVAAAPAHEATGFALFLAHRSGGGRSVAVARPDTGAQSWTDPDPASGAGEAGRGTSPDYVVVVGSYLDRDNAERTALRWSGHGAQIVPAKVDGSRFYRVVLAARSGLAAAEDETDLPAGSWRARLCGDETTTGEACVRL